MKGFSFMEGFWTVQFSGVQGWSSGVLTLIDGQLFGGDTSFLYTGTYAYDREGAQASLGGAGIPYPQPQTGMQARVHVKRYAPGINVMGRDEFDLELTGIVKGNTANVVGTVPGTQLRLTGTLTKQGELPARA
jgi:hypothetical protein